MSYQDFMAKVRYWDNKSANWILRHFYLLFFQAILVVVFVLLFFNTIKIVDVALDSKNFGAVERLLLTQSLNQSMIVFLLLLNSFWMLFMFNSMIRMRAIFKEMNYHLSKSTRRNSPSHQK